ncbi:hypothetical protein ACFSQE_18260 [Vogesella fluminis]|uniref:XRE family transcriptional regulator n=1 Tax=Vogesella fluminis TaxID=1069161 RepID=UPI001679837E|nr:XRE family transcriptional regulator [Vogesella fluminis]
MLERGLKTPMLENIEDLAAAIGCHPLTLAALAYLKQPASQAEVSALLGLVGNEMASIASKSSDR